MRDHEHGRFGRLLETTPFLHDHNHGEAAIDRAMETSDRALSAFTGSDILSSKRGGCMSEPITILIADDHTIVRQDIRSLLDMHPDLQVVGEAESAEAAIPQVEELVPDVVLLDLVLPGMNGVEATRQIKRISPRTQIVVLTSYAEDEHLFPARRAGALSYLLKDICPRELEAVRKGHRGYSVMLSFQWLLRRIHRSL